MTFHEQKKHIITKEGKVENKAPIHRASALGTSSSTLITPLRRLVYVDVVLPMGVTRIFGILHEGKVFTKVSAFAPTGVSDPKVFTPLSDRDYGVYKQWLQIKSKSKTRRIAESMQWTADNAERLISEGKEKEKKQLTGQSEYERGQQLNKEFQIPIISLKPGDILELQFDKSLWTVAKIKDDTLYAIQNNDPNQSERSIGTKGIVRGHRLK